MVRSDLLDSAKVPSIKDVGTFSPPLPIYGSKGCQKSHSPFYFLKVCPIFVDPRLYQLTKYINFLEAHSFLSSLPPCRASRGF